MKYGLAIFISALLLISCNKNEINENNEQIKVKYHGKYEIISSLSADSVDLNMDGVFSTNLLNENPVISNSELEVRILVDNKHLFSEMWPVEYIAMQRGEVFDSTRYHSTYSINYAMYHNGGYFEFTNSFKSIQLSGSIVPWTVNTLRSFDSISMEENEIIKVTAVRKLYTLKGWITTKIISRYKRYTIIT